MWQRVDKINVTTCENVQEIPDIESLNNSGLCGYFEHVEQFWLPEYLPKGKY